MGDQKVLEPEQPVEKRQRLSAAKRRELILTCAKEVFAQHSYREASTSKLAEAAGITEPMLYKHFGSKRGLFLAVLDHYTGRFIHQWRQRIEQHKREDGLQVALAEVAMDYHAVVKADPDVPRVIFQGSAAAADDPEFAEATGRYIMTVYHTFRGVMERAQEARLIDADVNLDAATWGCMSMAFAAQFGLMHSLERREEVEQWQDWMLKSASQLWLRGLHLSKE
ncbi:MAG TPA: TetR/AcrR family transcriptional regulator [Ktedonobacterales bacterium]|nr:TetR/AcrR family transcriptional regulator [Ktedonobacterales bacterium]